jgi:dTDP-4-amino-4,6-dideoxygalactose transaminase
MDLRPGEDAAAVDAAIRRVLARGWFVLGPEVEAFEAEFARACGAAHAVGVGTGTDALALSLRAIGIGPGDEVITSPLSAAYTALAVMMVGARPVFADIDRDRLTVDPGAVAAAITPRTRVLMPVHLYGQAADMAALEAIATRHGVAIIEDCAQAHLSTAGGRPVGTIGVAGAFSFYPTKNLGALGDGGAIVTNDAALADRLKRLRNGGQVARYQHIEFGVNTRLDEVQAAVLAREYRAALAGAPVRVPPEVDAGHVYHLFVVQSAARDALRAHLASRGIETLVHYPLPIPRQPALAAERPAVCPMADRACAELCSLPLHPGLSSDRVRAVAAAIHAFAPTASVTSSH